MNWTISLPSFWVTVGFVVIQGLVSLYESTFWPNKASGLNLSFITHGGMWGDVIFFPFINGFLWPYVRNGSPTVVLISLVLAAVITYGMHGLWGSGTDTNHMWPGHTDKGWIKDLSIAGYLHIVFMFGALSILFVYIVTPGVPNNIVLAIAIMLTVHTYIGAILPGGVATGVWLSTQTIATASAMVLAIWGVSIYKLF